MHKLSEIVMNDDTRELVLDKYYPLTSDEASTLIRSGKGNDLINFVNDGPYSYLRKVVI